MTDFSKLSDYIIGIRRTLHKHPELSGQEFQTQQLIRNELDKLGIPHRYSGLDCRFADAPGRNHCLTV